MKRIYLAAALLLILWTNSQASHIIGGDINYRYIGDSSGVANQYEITLRIYRDCSGGNSTFISGNITIQSACYPNMAVTLAPVLVPGVSNNELPPQHYEDCVNPGMVKCIGVRMFRGIVTLPGLCSDYSFVYQDCCRPSGIDNLVASAGQSFYFSATLNNLLGPNSLAKPKTEFLKAFCINQNANWNPQVTDANGDSLFYSIVGVKGSNGLPLTYAAAYSAQQPLPTNPPQSLNLNAATGSMQFIPATTGSYVVGLAIEEYRFDSATYSWTLIAKNTTELFAAVANTCSPTSQYVGFSVASGIYTDPNNGLRTFNHHCNYTTFSIRYHFKVACESIEPSGSDFRIVSNSGLVVVPVQAVTTNCNNNFEADTLTISLFSKFPANGKYFIYTKTGFDGNTVLNSCGFAQNEYDTLQINVTGCSSIGLSEQEIVPAPIIPTAVRLGNAFTITIPEALTGDYQLSFYNLQGAVLFTETFRGSGNWVIQNAGAITKPGMYVCRLQSATQADRQWQQKVVVVP